MQKSLMGLVILLLSGCGELRDERSIGPETWEEESPLPLTLATEDQIERSEVESGSYIVAFRGAPGSTFHLFKSFREEVRHNWVTLADTYLSDSRVRSIRYLTSVNLGTAKEPSSQKAKSFLPRSLHLAWTRDDLDEVPAVLSQVDFASPEAASEVLREWETTGDIWFAEPNGLSDLSEDRPPALMADGLEKQYSEASIEWHKVIKLEAAIAMVSGVTNPFRPVIAILDSGVDTAHPDLKDQIWARPGYSPDQANCGDDQFGCDTTKAEKDQLGSGQPWPYLTSGPGEPCPEISDPNKSAEQNRQEEGTCGHGTHVAGLVAGRLNVEKGAGGVCPWCQILPIKIIKAKDAKSRGQASDAAILAAMKYLTKFREEGKDRSYIRVANSSFGKYSRSRAVALMVSILSASPHDILIIGAAGNEDSIKRSYPGAFAESLGVSSVDAEGDRRGAKSDFSNYGPWVDVAAPGSNYSPGQKGLVSTLPGPGEYGGKQGTSMATPVVAGVAGLVLAVPENQNLSSQQLRDRLMATADSSIYRDNVANTVYNIPLRGDGTPTPLLGAGLVDAVAAVNGTSSGAATAQTGNRVDDGCGVIHGAGSEWTPVLTWVILAAPLGVLVGRRLRSSKRFALTPVTLDRLT